MVSCDPPITVPAWMSMMTSKSPGSLGIYGFRHRKPSTYNEGRIANSYSVREPTIWDIFGKAGLRSSLVGVPPAYPPKPILGSSVSCFLTPDANRDYTQPPQLKNQIEEMVGDYSFDLEFRTNERDMMLKELYAMTKKRFRVIRHMMDNERWNLFMSVEIGVDRIQHSFWKFFDKDHDKYIPGNQYEDAMREYYHYVDAEVGETLKHINRETLVLIVSDHGAKRMKGCFCVNEWLADEGYLKLEEKPRESIPIEKARVDWSRTKAWGWGGYYARIFLNLKGRESQGIIDREDYERERDELAARLREIRDPDGKIMKTKVHRPEDLYPHLRGDSPDLMVYFDDLDWRSAGTIGHDSHYLSENDTGPDDAVHSKNGIFILYDPQNGSRRFDEIDILDIAPTLLDRVGFPIADDMEGRVRGA